MEKFLKEKRKSFLISMIVILVLGVILVACGIVKNYTKLQRTQDDENFLSGEIKENVSQFGEPEKLGFKGDSGNEEVKDELNIEELKLLNFQVAKADQSILITGEIENTSNKTINNVELKFILYKTSDEGMYEYTMKIPEVIGAKEKRKVETCIGYKYEDIASLDVELEKIEFDK